MADGPDLGHEGHADGHEGHADGHEGHADATRAMPTATRAMPTATRAMPTFPAAATAIPTASRLPRRSGCRRRSCWTRRAPRWARRSRTFARCRSCPGRRAPPDGAVRRLRADRGLLRRRGRRRRPDRLAGAAVRRRAHAHRRDRPGDGAGRHPAGQPSERRSRRGASTRSGCTGWRSWPRSCNALLLLGGGRLRARRGGRRLAGDPEVDGGPMLVVACSGLGVNLVAFVLLRSGAKE